MNTPLTSRRHVILAAGSALFAAACASSRRSRASSPTSVPLIYDESGSLFVDARCERAMAGAT
jgi:hypothetical protein